ncbi:DUF7079 family protein [Niabella beijingensis]|uniref:DUF7079 family protein n=1 Tax=Niabella beijingensis TaxID=2872700 RepID=UPI001CC08FAC|nr:hypothetical protein [Niabella beijingensis]MBZ4191852.1 hypothetical protein [Niabella beijingensis]
MKSRLNIEERRPVWIALSEFYLDTEPDAADFHRLAVVLLKSPYSFAEIGIINKYEVFPVLQTNLLNPAGEWAGIDPDRLEVQILESLEKRNRVRKMAIESAFKAFKWMCDDYWEQLEEAYGKIKNAPGRST